MNKLKPCLFCGSKSVEVFFVPRPLIQSALVKCLTCGGKGPSIEHFQLKEGETLEQRAIAAWNTRPADKPRRKKLCELLPAFQKTKKPCPEVCGEMCDWWLSEKCLLPACAAAKCKTCGGTKRVNYYKFKPYAVHPSIRPSEPCPDCADKPEPATVPPMRHDMHKAQPEPAEFVCSEDEQNQSRCIECDKGKLHNVICTSLYYLATPNHKKDYNKLQARIKELEAEKKEEDGKVFTAENVYVCKCGRIGGDPAEYPDDYGTLGSDSGICCHDCGNEEFETVQDLRTQLAKAEGEAKIARCPCGGWLEGIGYDRRESVAVFQCKKCDSQMLIDMKIWNQTLKENEDGS